MIKCRYKTVETIRKHYGNDWGNLMLDGVDFEEKDLTDIKLPDDTELFQKIKDKSLSYTKLPKGDYSKHNFKGVSLFACEFTVDSIFSSDSEVFQKLKNKWLHGAMIPTGDYRAYNFKGMDVEGVCFSKDTLLPEYGNFLKDIYGILNCDFPINVIRNLHNYNLDGVHLYLDKEWYSQNMTQEQIEIIKTKYPDAVKQRYIHLPKKVCNPKELNNGYSI